MHIRNVKTRNNQPELDDWPVEILDCLASFLGTSISVVRKAAQEILCRAGPTCPNPRELVVEKILDGALRMRKAAASIQARRIAERLSTEINVAKHRPETEADPDMDVKKKIVKLLRSGDAGLVRAIKTVNRRFDKVFEEAGTKAVPPETQARLWKLFLLEASLVNASRGEDCDAPIGNGPD